MINGLEYQKLNQEQQKQMVDELNNREDSCITTIPTRPSVYESEYNFDFEAENSPLITLDSYQGDIQTDVNSTE